jgi:FeS assembly SUF system regulator
MLRLSKLSDYAIVLMTAMAAEPECQHSAAYLASRAQLSKATASKLLKRLAQSKLVLASRGRHGGYMLARSGPGISVTEIIEAIDGPLGLTECSVHGGNCEVESHCSVKPHWRLINQAVRRALGDVTLEQLVSKPPEIMKFWAGDREAPGSDASILPEA